MPLDEDLVIISACWMIIATAAVILQSKKRLRRWGTRPINRDRGTVGHYESLFLQMKECDGEQFFKYTRMRVQQFNHLLNLITPQLIKKSHHALTPEHRLAMTLRYLSQGGSMQVVAWEYFVGKATVSKIVNETCQVIWDVLSPIYLKHPSHEEWKSIATGYYDKWNMPFCLGAIDGKHVAIQAPRKSGTLWFNYKKTFSMVLLATCDYNYNFTLINVGAYGSQSDGGVFELSDFGKAMLQGNLDMPGSSNLPNTEIEFPHYFVADEAFPLKSFIMRPFPGRHLPDLYKVFNYRLSRARRTIENAFGILTARWRIFRSTIIASETTVQRLILAAVCLHNYVKNCEAGMEDRERRYCPNSYADREDVDGDVQQGLWREDVAEENVFVRIGRTGTNHYRRIASELRLKLANYLCSPEGEFVFQYRHALFFKDDTMHVMGLSSI